MNRFSSSTICFGCELLSREVPFGTYPLPASCPPARPGWMLACPCLDVVSIDGGASFASSIAIISELVRMNEESTSTARVGRELGCRARAGFNPNASLTRLEA